MHGMDVGGGGGQISMFVKTKGVITTFKMTFDQTHSNTKLDARISFLQTATK